MPGGEERHPRGGVGHGDHGAPPHRVEQPPENQGPEKIADREREDVIADAFVGHAVEAREHQRIGEEDRVVEKGLRCHQHQAERAAAAIARDEKPEDLAPRDAVQRAHRKRAHGFGKRTMACGHLFLDVGDDRFGLLAPIVHQQPARALRHVPAHEQNRETQHSAQSEGEPPAELRRQHLRIE